MAFGIKSLAHAISHYDPGHVLLLHVLQRTLVTVVQRIPRMLDLKDNIFLTLESGRTELLLTISFLSYECCG